VFGPGVVQEPFNGECWRAGESGRHVVLVLVFTWRRGSVLFNPSYRTEANLKVPSKITREGVYKLKDKVLCA
jgi:hypothetical protein